jgi:hypothetical protein
MVDEQQSFYPKDFEYLFVLNPNKMNTDEIVNYIDSCSNGSDRMFIYNAYYFILKQIPDKQNVAFTEQSFGDPRIKKNSKRNLVVSLKSSSAYCNVWLSPQEKLINYCKNSWQKFFAKVNPRKYEYFGYVDLICKKEIYGWVINFKNLEEKVMVDIYGDNVKRLSLCADVFREDLKLNGITDGFNGFRISPVPEELLICSSIKVKTQNDNTILTDNMLGVIREYEYISSIDIISKEQIAGWVVNLVDKEEKVMIDIYGDGKKKLSLCANQYREDLKLNGMGDGYHFFCISPVPEELLKCSTIIAKTQTNGYILLDPNKGIFRD